MKNYSKRIVLHFPHRLVDQPIVYRLVKDFDLSFNILKAFVTPKEEGLMVLELTGEEENYKKGIAYLKKCGVKIQPLSKDVVRDRGEYREIRASPESITYLIPGMVIDVSATLVATIILRSDIRLKTLDC